MHFAQQVEVLLHGFRKAETRVEHDLRHALAAQPADLFDEVGEHFPGQIVVAGHRLHRLRRAAHVHRDQRDAVSRRDGGDRRVRRSGRYVVDYARPEAFNRAFGYFGTERIDRYGRVGTSAADCFQCERDAAQFLVRRHVVGARPGRIAAHVENGRAVGDCPLRPARDIVGPGRAAALVE